jgi:bifunctional UDP-N-acetylglucosamine pyrophosphorylase/glucosamine-1-phosphate N-acetyltransferase
MSASGLAVVILAAGQGTRMKSSKAKVLHSIAGVPLVVHVLDTAEELGAAHILVVVRHERDAVAAAVAEQSPHAIIIDQDDVPGTGRAVEVALSGLPEDFNGPVVVLSADVPLLDAATLRALVSAHRHENNSLTILSAKLDNPSGFGRIIRSADGHFEGIVEQKDASCDQLQVAEINAGV